MLFLLIYGALVGRLSFVNLDIWAPVKTLAINRCTG